jgi:hypothetical protein
VILSDGSKPHFTWAFEMTKANRRPSCSKVRMSTARVADRKSRNLTWKRPAVRATAAKAENGQPFHRLAPHNQAMPCGDAPFDRYVQQLEKV